jgi:hypothetical protein
MAIVNFYKSADMLNPQIFYGSVNSATSTSITISDNLGRSGTYIGSFYYSNNYLSGGTVNGYTAYDNWSLSSTVRGINIDALTVNAYLNSNNAVGLHQMVLNGADSISGSNVSDYLKGWNGNDTIYGGAGNDVVDGGTGTDALVLSGIKSNYSISKTSNGWLVADKVGADGADRIIDLEVIQFGDGTDVIAIANSTTQYVALLYQGALGRTPDAGGLAFWTDSVNHLPIAVQNLGWHGLAYGGANSIAAGFTHSAEFINKYGALSNSQFVTQLYSNILDRTPDSGGFDYWVSNLNNGASREELLVGFAESNEAINNASLGFVGQTGVVHDAWLFLS